MRDILFKAKAENIDGTKDWVVGYLSKCDNEFIICDDDGIGIFVDPDTICQYTGLTDKNGNNIWENDIVRHGMITETVIFREGSFGVYSNGSAVHLHSCYNHLEVIGNIFDN